MKIEFEKQMVIPPSPDGIRSKESPASGANFSELLNSAMKEEMATETVLPPPLIQSSIPISNDLFITGCKDMVTKGIGVMLDSLESYEKMLSSPASTLREMSPLIHQIEAGVNSLSSLGLSMNENDPLKEILNQTLVTANVEIARFKRGDYVPT